MTQTREGGCLCGAVRYEAQWSPKAVVTCHCTHCQKQAGSALSIIGVFARDAIAVTGELKTFEDRGSSGQAVLRQFCPNCGSPILSDTAAARAGGIIFLKAGTLDDTSDLRPVAHYWVQSAQPWFPFTDGAKCLERE